MTTNENVMISVRNLAEKATIWSSSETLSGFGWNNLLSQETSKSCRINFDMPDLSSEANERKIFIGIRLPRVSRVNLVSLVKCNLKQDFRYSVIMYLNGGEVYSSGVYDETNYAFGGNDTYETEAWGEFSWGGLIDAEQFANLPKNIIHVTDQTYEVDTIELRVITSDLTAQFFESFLLWIDEAFQPTVGADYGAEISQIDETETKRNRSGGRTYGSPVRRRMITMDLKDVHKTEAFRNLVGPIFQGSGVSKLCFVVLTPLDDDMKMFQSLVGNLSNTQKATHAYWNRLAIPFEFEESP
jgi:hypothetical protein